MRIFVNNVDSYVGRALCADLRNVAGEENRIFGTLTSEGQKVEPQLLESLGVKRVVSRFDRTLYLEDILSCSLIIYDLHGADLQDVENVIKHLKLAKLEHKTTFVLISSVSVWAKTITETKDVSTRGDDEGDETEEIAEGDEVYIVVNSYEKSHCVPRNARGKVKEVAEGSCIVDFPAGQGSYKTADLKKDRLQPEVLTDEAKDRRTPQDSFLQWKYLETLTLSLGPKEKLRPHVISAGVLYGNGEVTFNQLFKAAWLTLPSPAHVITKTMKAAEIQPGTNYIPCVHVRDVARLVRVVASDESANAYLVAVDRSRLTQAEIIWGIVKEMSNKKDVPAFTRDEVEQNYLAEMDTKEKAQFLDAMTLDLIMKPSAPMMHKDFDWWCKKGLVENMKKVADEFCRWRNLRHIKTVVLGPPGAGAERYCANIAEHYLHQDPPHLTFDKILSDAMQAGTPFAESLKSKVERKVPLPLKTKSKIVKKQLLSNVCRYRGYVLEGYPTTFAEAEDLFMEAVPGDDADPVPAGAEDEAEDEDGEVQAPEEKDPWLEEEEEEGGPKTRLNTDIVPEFVIALQSTEERCRARIFQGQSGFSGGEEEFDRQTIAYRKANLLKDGSVGTMEFFTEVGSVKVLNVDVDGESDEAIFQVIRVYLESKGSFFNYLRSEEDLVSERQAKIAIEERKAMEIQEQQRQAVRAGEQVVLQERKEREAARRQVIADQEASILEAEAMPLRQYLMVNVVPTLSEGLQETCKQMPEDPIEYLAQYLFAHAQDIAPQLEASRSSNTRGAGAS